MGRRPWFHISDSAQQIVGGFLLAGPFVVTEEVWQLAQNMTGLHVAGTIALVLSIGYGTLYFADRDRDPEVEKSIFGVPVRFLTLVAVSYFAVISLTFLLAAPRTFDAGMVTTLKVISIGAIFSVVGAATADSLF